mmetsp:Transcript_36059/g.108977  ORF Transcript_36059/g.108977 Transcript_36059/m.108977 type:complete len:313 (-) Transcript_36059:3018-3956(-)
MACRHWRCTGRWSASASAARCIEQGTRGAPTSSTCQTRNPAAPAAPRSRMAPPSRKARTRDCRPRPACRNRLPAPSRRGSWSAPRLCRMTCCTGPTCSTRPTRRRCKTASRKSPGTTTMGRPLRSPRAHNAGRCPCAPPPRAESGGGSRCHKTRPGSTATTWTNGPTRNRGRRCTGRPRQRNHAPPQGPSCSRRRRSAPLGSTGACASAGHCRNSPRTPTTAASSTPGNPQSRKAPHCNSRSPRGLPRTLRRHEVPRQRSRAFGSAGRRHTSGRSRPTLPTCPIRNPAAPALGTRLPRGWDHRTAGHCPSPG